MVDLEQEQVTNISTKRKELLSTAMKRTSEWVVSQEIPSDVTVNVGGTSFSLHKFPLVTKCGYIRKLVAESATSVVQIPDIPGGAEAFELAAKFCYGINFEISVQNISMLRCVAEYLEMTEEHAVGNLIGRTESYLNEMALKSLPGAISVLHASENFLPLAEKAKLVSRCIDAIALLGCKDSDASPLRTDSGLSDLVSSTLSNSKSIVDWWAEDLTNLRIDLFQRVLIAMMARGFKHYALGSILMLYAQKSLQGLDTFGKNGKNIEPGEEYKKRVVLETIVSLLPREKNTLSVSFLSMLLRAAMYLETTVACRHDLEMRMGLRLAEAELDDLLIPSYSLTGTMLFDVETVKRILMNFLESQMGVNRIGTNGDCPVSPLPNDMERVTGMMESYLAEIASDRNLSVSKFIGVAELIPEQSRITEDGMYRAIDIYMKVHPALSDMERKKVCSVMDSKKLSREACTHAAQNDRLPVQIVVQVLFQEQQRLREIVESSLIHPPVLPAKSNSSLNEVSNLQRENQGLKLELAKMKMRLKEVDKSSVNGSPSQGEKPRSLGVSFISSVSKRLARIIKADGVISPQGQSSKGRTKPSRDRRHSIS